MKLLGHKAGGGRRVRGGKAEREGHYGTRRAVLHRPLKNTLQKVTVEAGLLVKGSNGCSPGLGRKF